MSELGDQDGGAVRLSVRHSAASLVPAAVLVFAGLVLSTCSLNGYVAAIQFEHPDNRPFFAIFELAGLMLVMLPALSFINAEVRLVEGVVSKRGALRITRRWPADSFQRIRMVEPRYLRLEGWKYVLYEFVLQDSKPAFVLSPVWWSKADIERLAGALNLVMPRTL